VLKGACLLEVGMVYWNIFWRGEKLLSFRYADLVWLLSTLSTKAGQDHEEFFWYLAPLGMVQNHVTL
jgi:hypothetical protein